MSYEIDFEPLALQEYLGLDGSQQKQVSKAIEKVAQNPLPQSEGGYGKPLGNKGNSKLHGLLKIKLKKLGIRVIYKNLSSAK